MSAVRGLIVTAAALTGLTIAGMGSAAAQPDYSTLPVDPNAVTDSNAYIAEAPRLNPNGKPGIEAVYSHRDGSRKVTDTIWVLDSPQAASAAMDQTRGALSGEVVGTPQVAPVGTGGSIVSGNSPDGTKSVTVLTFTEGDAFTAIEFDGPANDPVPVDLVTDYGQKQAAVIRDALSA
ncbi:hypothetical protein [Mycobacterium sp. MMS18-G62]